MSESMRFEPGTPALLLHSGPEDLVPALAACEALDWRVAATEDEVRARIADHRPRVMLSIKHSEFPGPIHARALGAPGLRWFHVGGSGRDHLGDPPPGVLVTDSAGALAPFFAERSIAALLALSTRLVEHVRDQAEALWRPTRFESLSGKTLLVVGAGHTGTAVARLAVALGMRAVGVRSTAHAPHPPFEEMLSGRAALGSALAAADVVSLHLRVTEETRGLVGADLLGRMRPGAVLLNASRGAVLDEGALLDELGNGRLAGAWLDVFDEEPLPPASPLWRNPRVLVTPHCADQVEGFAHHFARRFVEVYRGLTAD